MTSIFRYRLHFPHLAKYRNIAHFKRLTFNLHLYAFPCSAYHFPSESPLLRYNGIGSRCTYRECGSYAWAPGHQDHTDLCQGAAHHHRAPCHSPAAFNQLRHDRIFPLVTATFPTHGRWQLFFRIYTSVHVCRTMHED